MLVAIHDADSLTCPELNWSRVKSAYLQAQKRVERNEKVTVSQQNPSLGSIGLLTRRVVSCQPLEAYLALPELVLEFYDLMSESIEPWFLILVLPWAIPRTAAWREIGSSKISEETTCNTLNSFCTKKLVGAF